MLTILHQNKIMKVLVSFKPNKKFDNFQGSRMRKTIKGALEFLNIPYTDSLVDYYDVAHLISPEQDGELNDIVDGGAPVVVSALYTEDDPVACYLEMDSKTKKSVLTQRALKFLNKADLVLVPCEQAKELLTSSGVTTPIEICLPGVNMSRFDFSKQEEKEIFYRYYREDKNKKLVIAVGEYKGKMEGLSSFIGAARKSPNAMFYYIGKTTASMKLNLKINRIFSTAPKNVKFVDVPPDDIYRSALLNADVFMIPGYKVTGVTSIVEAMAAKTQIIARKSTVLEGILEDGETAHLAEFSETLASLTRDYLDGKIKPTTTSAYQHVCTHTLKALGEELNKHYQTAIQNKVKRSLKL